MSIPDEIKNVKRPPSTVIRIGYKGEYLVIKRTSKRVSGKKNPVTIDQGTIGKIINGVYVPLESKGKKRYKDNELSNIDIKTFGPIKLCLNNSLDLLNDLIDIYGEERAKQLYCIALLRACDEDIRNRDIEIEYQSSYLSELYKNVALSKTTLSNLMLQVGQNYSKIHLFMENRMNKANFDKCIIDGTIKKCNCTSSTMSEFSRKAHEKTRTDISLIYLYNFETKEPLACKVYPGNMLDQTAIQDFLSEYSLNTSNSPMAIFDKGFFTSKTIQSYEKEHILNYLCALKENDQIIIKNNIYDSILTPLADYKEKVVFYSKTKIDDSHFVYAFRDPSITQMEDTAYTSLQVKKKKFDEIKYKEKRKMFGTLVLISNKDKEPLDIYLAYLSRWEIETMFNLYKCIIDLDTTNVHNDYRIYANEFINYLSLIIASRLRNLFNKIDVELSNNKLKKISSSYSYRQVMRHLSKIQIVRLNNKDWKLTTTVKYIDRLREALKIDV